MKSAQQPDRDPAPEVPTAQDRKILRVVAHLLMASSLFVLLTVSIGYGWITSDQGRHWLRRIIEEQVSSDQMQLTIGAISELSVSTLKVERIQLVEQGEILLDVPSFQLSLKPHILLLGRVHITKMTAPEMAFRRFPAAVPHDQNTKESNSFPDIRQWSLPDLRIDKLQTSIYFMDHPDTFLSMNGQVKIDPNRIMKSHIDVDIKDQNEQPLVEIRFLPEKIKPLLFMRIQDPESVLLTNFAAMENAPPLDIVWQGTMQETDLWKGELKFSLPDVVQGDFSVSLTGLARNPSLAMQGVVSPVAVTDNTVQLDMQLAQQGLTLKAFLDHWIQDALVIEKPVIELTAKPAVQFIVHQGYQWDLKAHIQAIMREGKSISPYGDDVQLTAQGRLGRTKLSVANLSVGNMLWQAVYAGYYHLAKAYIAGEAMMTLHDQELQAILGGIPIVKTGLRWDAQKGVQLADGVLDSGSIQGSFNGVVDASNTLSFHLNAQASDFQPYYQGQILFAVSATGALDYPDIKAELHSDHIILESGMEIHALEGMLEGNPEHNQVTLQAALSDGEYRLTTSLAVQDDQYHFKPTRIILPLGQIDGQIVLDMQDSIAIKADLQGRVEDQNVLLQTEAEIDSQDDMTEILLKKLAVEWRKMNLRLQKPAILQQRQNEIIIQPLSLSVNDGVLSAQALYSSQKIDATVTAKKLPLDAFNAMIDTGRVDGVIRLTGTKEHPEMVADLELTNLVPHHQDEWGETISLSGTLDGYFSNNVMTIGSVLTGMRGVRLETGLTVPMTLIPFDLQDNAALKGRAKGQVDLMAIVALAMLDGHELHGRADIDIAIAGTLAAPQVTGHITLANGRYENKVYGTRLTDLNVMMDVSASQILVRQVSAHDQRNGLLNMSGKIGLKPLDNPDIDLVLQSKKMQVLNSPSLAANVTSDIFIKGRVDNLVISGDVYIHDAEIFVDDIAGSGDPYRDYTIIEKNLPRSSQNKAAYRITRAEESGSIRLDIRLDAPNAIFVRGPGLDSEWSAALSVRGTTDRPRLNGTLSVLRGSYQFVDLLVNLKPKSQVVFSGDASNPELALSGTIPGRSMNATLSVTGNVEKPVVALTSDQGLPSDEILSRVLFGRSASGLSPAQAVQVARILARLSGQGGTGFDPIGVMRNALGVDTLGINMGDDDGMGPTVSVGKYISDDIYVSVEQGSGPNSSAVRSEIRLTDSIQLETQNSAENNKIGIQWRWNY